MDCVRVNCGCKVELREGWVKRRYGLASKPHTYLDQPAENDYCDCNSLLPSPQFQGQPCALFLRNPFRFAKVIRDDIVLSSRGGHAPTIVRAIQPPHDGKKDGP